MAIKVHRAPPTGRCQAVSSSALVVDDDPRILARMRAWLEERGFHVICAETGKAALSAAHSTTIDVAVVDYRLRGWEDGLLLARTLASDHGIPFILISGFLNTRVTVEAMRLGAVDVLDKPLTAECVVRAIGQAISGAVASNSLPHPNLDLMPCSADDSPAQRLARLVLLACEAKRDPKKMVLFSNAAMVSSALFRTVCQLCDVRPRNICDLGRVLRAISLSIQDDSPIISHFSVGDPRTAARLMWRAGIEPEARCVVLRDFLHQQHFVDVSTKCVRELGHLSANSPLFFPQARNGTTKDL